MVFESQLKTSYCQWQAVKFFSPTINVRDAVEYMVEYDSGIQVERLHSSKQEKKTVTFFFIGR